MNAFPAPAKPPGSTAPPSPHRALHRAGLTQMSLVEHALCPIDSAASLRHNLVHETHYFYTDKHRNRRKATARVLCPDGLSACDELYLWGLLALTLSQKQPGTDFYATPHFCLRQLGCIEQGSDKGGETYRLFRDAIYRLSAVTYQSDRFYDPLRGEHRRVGFGFLSYSLPLDPLSSRAWRFAWDAIFFEFCQATGSALSFDLPTYKQLSAANRRLYLLLKKIFWRSEVSPAFDLMHLAVNVLGFSPTLPAWKLKQKLIACIETLLDGGILRLPPECKKPVDLFTKRGAGRYSVSLHCGEHFDRSGARPTTEELSDSPLFDPLHTIGLDLPSIRRVLSTYAPRLISEWADITLAAQERNGKTFFTSGPQAYFLDNLKHAAKGTRTAPDWWRAMRLEEEKRRRQAESPVLDFMTADERRFDEFLQTEARHAFDQLMTRVFEDLRARDVPEREAREKATYIARMNLRGQFRRSHPEHDSDLPQRAFDLGRPGTF
jgi:hypothetical protein